MSNYNTIRDYVASCASMLYFQYHGKEGHVDPYSSTEFLLWFDGREMTVHDSCRTVHGQEKQMKVRERILLIII